jgi:hypothetical protein
MRDRKPSPEDRRFADWLNPTGTREVHSLVDNVYKRKNLELTWKKVKARKGAGVIDGQVGHLNYYGVSGNWEALRSPEADSTKLASSVGRRSQKARALTWARFKKLIASERATHP